MLTKTRSSQSFSTGWRKSRIVGYQGYPLLPLDHPAPFLVAAEIATPNGHAQGTRPGVRWAVSGRDDQIEVLHDGPAVSMNTRPTLCPTSSAQFVDRKPARAPKGNCSKAELLLQLRSLYFGDFLPRGANSIRGTERNRSGRKTRGLPCQLMPILKNPSKWAQPLAPNPRPGLDRGEI